MPREQMEIDTLYASYMTDGVFVYTILEPDYRAKIAPPDMEIIMKFYEEKQGIK